MNIFCAKYFSRRFSNRRFRKELMGNLYGKGVGKNHMYNAKKNYSQIWLLDAVHQ